MRPEAAVPPGSLLIDALRNPGCYPHPVSIVEILETHISWIVLTGTYAYKIKKPVNLGFLDFSTLTARRHFCKEELRLNRRLAPTLYEAVVPITGTTDAPCIGGDGTPIDYAVRMREFPSRALASCLLADGALDGNAIHALAVGIARFHANTVVAAGVTTHGSPYGAPETIIAATRENFAQLEPLMPEPADRACLDAVRTWTENEYASHLARFTARQAQGFVRECHGDLHLDNIVMLNGELKPFDCIEFNPALRWIDVMSEAAFLIMDLVDRGSRDLAFRFLNAYLEKSGDYAGLAVLRFYVVYRAMVRAKVHALRAAQQTADEHAGLLAACRRYLELARCCTRHEEPALLLMHGLSGSGKSMIAEVLAETEGAIRLRSDVERARLAGSISDGRAASGPSVRSYTAVATLATYNRLLDLARVTLNAGYTAILDATFLQRWQRDLFRREARARGLRFLIVNAAAPEHVLRARIAARLAGGKDVSEADHEVLALQLARQEPLAADERADVLHIDTTCGDMQNVARLARDGLRALTRRADPLTAP